MNYDHHVFIDLSRRKSYICGICRRDITHPCHQPTLPGTKAAITARVEDEPEQVFEPEPEPSQMSLF